MPIAIILLSLGIIAVFFTPREENPQISVVSASVVVEYPGANSREVQELVTKPLEQTLHEIPNVEHIYGVSVNGRSIVMAMFEIGSNEEESILYLHDRVIQNANIFPSGASKPMVKRLDVNEMPIVNLAIYSDTLNKQELYQRSLDLIHPLSQHDDISVIGVLGAYNREFIVRVSPSKLQAYNITFKDIMRSIENSSASIGLGDIVSNKKLSKIEFNGFIESKKDIQEIKISTAGGKELYLTDVASIEDSINSFHTRHESYIQTGKANDADDKQVVGKKHQVTLYIAKKAGTNAVKVSKTIQQQMDKLQKNYNDFEYTITKDDGKKADESVNALIEHVIIAIVIIVVLLLLTLGWREGLVVAVTIPLILGLTLYAGMMIDQTINRITLFALIIALGLLVDDTIVVIENIHRHFSMKLMNKRDAIIYATNEIGNPTILATLAVIAAFIPMFFVTGMMGPYMAPIPFNVPVSMIASLFIAFIFAPWLALHFLPYSKKIGNNEHHFDIKETRLYIIINKFLTSMLESRKNRYFFFAGLIFLFVFSIFLMLNKTISFKLLPDGSSNRFSIDVEIPFDSTLSQTKEVATCIEEVLLLENDVKDIESFIGLNGVVDFPAVLRAKEFKQGDYIAQIDVNLRSKKERDELSYQMVDRIRPLIKSSCLLYPNTTIKMIQEPAGPAVSATVIAEISGQNTEGKKLVGSYIEKQLKKIEGVVDASIWQNTKSTKYQFTPRQEVLSRLNISKSELMNIVYPMVYGSTVSHVHIPGYKEQVGVFIRYDEKYLSSIENIKNLPITIKDITIRLGDLVNVQEQMYEKEIYSKDLHEIVMVTSEVSGRGSLYVLGDLWSALENDKESKYKVIHDGNLRHKVTLVDKQTNESYTVDWTGEWELTFDVFRDLGSAFAGAVVMIFLLLIIYYKSLKMSFLVVAGIPLTLIGVIFGHWFMSIFNMTYFTATSMIGFIALAGIVVRNTNLLVDYTNELIHDGHSIEEAVVLSAATRARPIILTALAIIFGSVIILSDPIWEGLAISLVFGTIGATLLTILVTPLLYWKLNKRFVAGLDLSLLQSKVTLLQNIDIFSFMDKKELFMLAKRVKQLKFAVDKVIIRQFDEGHSMYLLVEGELSVFTKKSHRDLNEVKVAELGAGEFFGEMSLLTGDLRSATVVANNDVIVFQVTKEHLEDLLEKYPLLLKELIDVVTKRQGKVSEDEKEDMFQVASRRFIAKPTY